MPFPPFPDAALAAPRAAGPSAHVTATLADRFIEFEFVLGDPDLAVELVLTGDQFTEFCHAQRVTRMEVAPEARAGWERLRRRMELPFPAIAS